MSDIIARLREVRLCPVQQPCTSCVTIDDAIAEIERLRAREAELRTAIGQMAGFCKQLYELVVLG